MIQPSGPGPKRLTILAALCAVYGVQALAAAIRLFPFWLAAAREGRYGSGSFAWLELGSAVSGLTAAYGLWQRRRWARVPFLVCVLLGIATLILVSLFAAQAAVVAEIAAVINPNRCLRKPRIRQKFCLIRGFLFTANLPRLPPQPACV